MSRRANEGDAQEPKVEGPSGLSLLRDERGATFVEYITIIVLVAVASMAAWSLWKAAVKRDASQEYTTFGTPPDE
jgi:Flp pilus assembly pilin Flp